MQTQVPTGRAIALPERAKADIEKADGQLAGSPSVLFDAVASILMPDQAEKLTKDSTAVQWFVDAHGHCKTIAHCKGPVRQGECLT